MKHTPEAEGKVSAFTPLITSKVMIFEYSCLQIAFQLQWQLIKLSDLDDMYLHCQKDFHRFFNRESEKDQILFS